MTYAYFRFLFFWFLRAIAQTELRKANFDKTLLARIEYTLRYHDPCRTGTNTFAKLGFEPSFQTLSQSLAATNLFISGRVDRETLRATLKGAKLPLFRDLLDYMVDK